MRAQKRDLLDHLVGAREHQRRDGEAEGLGGRPIDGEFEYRRPLDRNIAGRYAAKYSRDLVGHAQAQRGAARAVTDQTARAGHFRPFAHCWQPRLERECRELLSITLELRRRADHQRLRARRPHRCERGRIVGRRGDREGE